MLTPSQQRELIRRYRRRMDTLTAAGGAVLSNAWLSVRGLDEENITELAALAGPRIGELSRRAAATTTGTVNLLVGGQSTAALTLIEPDWRGPFTHAWGALGRGEDLEAAITSGAARAEAAGRDAVTSSARRSAAGAAPEVTTWRRIPDADACEWCRTVAGQDYYSAESADFGHDRCGCLVLPNPR